MEDEGKVVPTIK